MKIIRLFCLISSLLVSMQSFAQEFYNFAEKYPDKGRLAITPIGGVFIKSGGGISFLASGRVQYFISDHISAGAQYVQLFETGAEDFGWIGELGAPKQSVHLIVGGHYFPSNGRLGFHGTAGLGYILSGGDFLTSYFDIGGDFKISKSITLQLQIIEVGFAATGVGFGVQFKL